MRSYTFRAKGLRKIRGFSDPYTAARLDKPHISSYSLMPIRNPDPSPRTRGPPALQGKGNLSLPR